MAEPGNGRQRRAHEATPLALSMCRAESLVPRAALATRNPAEREETKTVQIVRGKRTGHGIHRRFLSGWFLLYETNDPSIGL